jgi:hypothetical protein
MINAARKLVLGISVAALALTASPASATVYVNKRVCGGDTFATCAAVWLDVTGTLVTFRMFNLSGNTAASFGNVTNAGTVFNGIGLYNVPTAVNAIIPSFGVSGAPLNPANPPGQWVLQNNASVGFLMDFSANANAALKTRPFDNGIASACNTALLPSQSNVNNSFYGNPCADPNSQPFSNWVTFQFSVNQTWDASHVGIMFRGYNAQAFPNPYGGPATHGTECWDSVPPAGVGPGRITCTTVSPEPMTMTLLATGLVGLGGLGYVRRRKAARS